MKTSPKFTELKEHSVKPVSDLDSEYSSATKWSAWLASILGIGFTVSVIYWRFFK